jgi:hypothetical protein
VKKIEAHLPEVRKYVELSRKAHSKSGLTVDEWVELRSLREQYEDRDLLMEMLDYISQLSTKEG